MNYRLGPPLAAFSMLLALVLFALAGLYTFRQQNKVDAQLCQSAVDNRDGLRDTWIAARSLVIQNQSESERTRSEQFFDSILATIPTLVCVDNKPVLRPPSRG